MHMVQHVLLLDVAPILLILGLTKVLLRPATRRIHRIEQRVGWLAAPLFAVVLYTAAMWIWHIPALYDAAAEHTGDPRARAPHLHARRLPLLVAPAVAGQHAAAARGHDADRLHGSARSSTVGFLGILLTFAPNAIFSYYTNQPQYWGLDPDSDQALAGVIMAIEQSIVMGIALVVLFTRMLAQSEREEQRRERYEASGSVAVADRARARRRSTMPVLPAIAPIRIASDAISVPGSTTESFSAAPSPIISAVADRERTLQAHVGADRARRARSTRAARSASRRSARCPRRCARPRRPPRRAARRAARRASRRTCPP